MCVSARGFTTCFGGVGPTFRVPTPPGFPTSLGPGDSFYHAYDVQRQLNGTDANCVMDGMMNSPTPGNSYPALPQGTRNNAVVGGLDNWVSSYRTADLITGAPVEVNIAGTNDGSLFGPGYVVRYISHGVAHTAGEGLNWKQSPLLTGDAVQAAANEALWGRQMSKIISSAKQCECGH